MPSAVYRMMTLLCSLVVTLGCTLLLWDVACDGGRMANERRLRSGVALGCGAPLHSPWHRSARGLPCDRRRRRRRRIPLF